MPDSHTRVGRPASRNGSSGHIAALAVPDVGFGAPHLAAVHAVMARVVGIENAELAFISGSLAAGLGHALSDIDVYVALADGSAPDRSYHESGFIVQINPVPRTQLETLMREASRYADTADARRQTEMGESELTLLVRFAIGTVIASQRSDVPPAGDRLLTARRILMNRNAYVVASLAEDTLGALDIGDTLTALQASQMALEAAADCALAGAGDVYVGRKFQLRRWARTQAVRPVLQDLWACLGQPDLVACDHDVRTVVLRRMLLSSHLVSSALLDGWDTPMRTLRAFADRRADGGPLRSPWVVPVRFADAWGMAGPDVGYRTTEAMVRLWQALDGREAGTVARSLAGGTAGVSTEILDAAIAALVEKKAAASDSGSIR